MVITKETAKNIIKGTNDRYANYMMELVENLPRFSKDSARYLKYMATFVMSDIKITLSPWSFTPEINFCRVDWQLFDVLGKGLYYGQLTKEKVIGIIEDIKSKEGK